MNTNMLKIAVVAVAALSLSACGSTSTPIPQGTAAAPAATQAPAAEPAPAAPVEPAAVSTCDVAKEAFLTGSPAGIDAALRALKIDKTADATAREYADYYINRDKDSKDLKEMDKGLINMSCS